MHYITLHMLTSNPHVVTGHYRRATKARTPVTASQPVCCNSQTPTRRLPGGPSCPSKGGTLRVLTPPARSPPTPPPGFSSDCGGWQRRRSTTNKPAGDYAEHRLEYVFGAIPTLEPGVVTQQARSRFRRGGHVFLFSNGPVARFSGAEKGRSVGGSTRTATTKILLLCRLHYAVSPNYVMPEHNPSWPSSCATPR